MIPSDNICLIDCSSILQYLEDFSFCDKSDFLISGYDYIIINDTIKELDLTLIDSKLFCYVITGINLTRSYEIYDKIKGEDRKNPNVYLLPVSKLNINLRYIIKEEY